MQKQDIKVNLVVKDSTTNLLWNIQDPDAKSKTQKNVMVKNIISQNRKRRNIDLKHPTTQDSVNTILINFENIKPKQPVS